MSRTWFPHPGGDCLALGGNGEELLLHVDGDELGEEGEVVAGVETVPHRQEHQGRHLQSCSVANKELSLVLTTVTVEKADPDHWIWILK